MSLVYTAEKAVCQFPFARKSISLYCILFSNTLTDIPFATTI